MKLRMYSKSTLQNRAFVQILPESFREISKSSRITNTLWF